MPGMHTTTGTQIKGLAHLHQSIADILTTPIGTRVMRRDYGSELFDLLDQPDNATTQLRIYAAIATALLRWEPRLRLAKINFTRTATPGRVHVELTGYVFNNPLALAIPLNLRA